MRVIKMSNDLRHMLRAGSIDSCMSDEFANRMYDKIDELDEEERTALGILCDLLITHGAVYMHHGHRNNDAIDTMIALGVLGYRDEEAMKSCIDFASPAHREEWEEVYERAEPYLERYWRHPDWYYVAY